MQSPHQLPDAPPPPESPPPPENPPPPPEDPKSGDDHPEPPVSVGHQYVVSRRREPGIARGPTETMMMMRKIAPNRSTNNTATSGLGASPRPDPDVAARRFHSSASPVSTWVMSSTP